MIVEEIHRQLNAHVKVIEQISSTLSDTIVECAELLVTALRAGRKVLVMGNGGSAADAQHLAAELVGRFLMERRALPAMALSTDTSILTAVGNDYGFDLVFRRQVEALAQPGDVLIGISTSGNSQNVKFALEAGHAIGTKTVGLLGSAGGEIGPLVDLSLNVPSRETPRVQEAHSVIIHILCDLIEKELFKTSSCE